MTVNTYNLKKKRTDYHSWLPPVLINASIILVSVAFVIIAFTEEPFTIKVDVMKAHGAADTLQTFSDAAVLSAGKFYLENAATPLKYLAPRAPFDPLYSVLFFLCSIVIVAFFWDFTYKKPFTRRTLWGLRILVALFILFFIADFWRYEWFDEQVRQITSNQYSYEKPMTFASPLPWLCAILIRIIWIIKSGLSLQKDADLTI